MRGTASQALITVVVDAELRDANQHKLLHAMFRSLALSEEMFEIIYDLDANNLKKHIQKAKPRVIIALGCKVEACDKTPIIVMEHLSDLLQNPINKKKVYADLGRVAACLMLDSNESTQG